jgi:hypothetical protein
MIFGVVGAHQQNPMRMIMLFQAPTSIIDLRAASLGNNKDYTKDTPMV